MAIDKFNNIISDYKIHEAVIYDDIYVVKHLLDNGTDVDLLDDKGLSPLYYAVNHNRLEIAGVLIEKGARLNDEKSNLLRIAVGSKNVEMVDLLIKKGINVQGSRLLLNVELSFPYVPQAQPITKLLIKNGANVNVTGFLGTTPLHNAIVSGNLKMTKMLMDNGADINVKDTFGNTPFIESTFCKSKKSQEAGRYLSLLNRERHSLFQPMSKATWKNKFIENFSPEQPGLSVKKV